MNEDASMPLISEKEVERLMGKCVVKEDEVNRSLDIVGVDGVYSLDKDALEFHRLEILDMLSNLPERFRVTGEMGGLLPEGKVDREGNIWTESNTVTEHLFVLGIGIGVVEYLFPRGIWEVLPLGVPYYIIGM